jgi:hypothetical protein
MEVIRKPSSTRSTMSKESTPRNPDLQGEGNRDADRQYREAAERHAKSGKSEAEGRAAEEALEGDESKTLADAEKAGKAGPKAPARH